MKKNLLIILLAIFSMNIMAQISVQTVGYWSIGDAQSFNALYQKIKIKDKDTILDMKIHYEIDITIIDSTANSYTIEWHYKNYSMESDNKIAHKLAKIAEDMKVQIKTDEFGAFEEVVNWEEIQDYISKAVDTIKNELKDFPKIDQIMDQTSILYSSKEAIEGNSINDILQYYSFHGGKYTAQEDIITSRKTRNNLGGDNFDTQIEISLSEVDIENDTYVMRVYSAIDSTQLTNVTYEYIKDITEKSGAEMIKREEFPTLQNETWLASRIHGSTGWTTYSISTKEVILENEKNIEETTIQLK